MLFGTEDEFFNPDLVTREILLTYPEKSLEDANSLAWHEGLRQLRAAIAQRKSFAFETTLGANTIPGELLRAAGDGVPVRIWYVGLSSVELHIARVAARVASGGHDIPEEKIRKRYEKSVQNLMALMPHLVELRVYDNSAEANPSTGQAAEPLLLLHMEGGRLVGPDLDALAQTPEWAKPLVELALTMEDASE